MFTSPTASIKNSSPGYVSWIDILLNIIVIDGKNKMIVKLMGYFIIENTENMDNTALLRVTSTFPAGFFPAVFSPRFFPR